MGCSDTYCDGRVPKIEGEWGRGQKGVCAGWVGQDQSQGPQGRLGTAVVT